MTCSFCLRRESNDLSPDSHDLKPMRMYRHKTRLHIGQLVKDTSDKLKLASENDHRMEVAANKKITDAKLDKDFQVVLQEFQKAQRLVAERETSYTPFVSHAVLPCSYTAIEIDSSTNKNPEQRALLVEFRRQEILLLDNEIAFNEAIIDEREHGLQEVQQQIGDVNDIFKDLVVLVHEQGVMIDDVSSNIEGSCCNCSEKNPTCQSSQDPEVKFIFGMCCAFISYNSKGLLLQLHADCPGGSSRKGSHGS